MSDHKQHRAATVVSALLDAIRGVVAEHRISYEEYNAAIKFAIDVGNAGEWPLFADVFFEADVEKMSNRNSPASDSSIEGPYYVPCSALLARPFVMPMREDEGGDPLIFGGSVTGVDGTPLAGATVDMWQCDRSGTYSDVPYGDGRELPPSGNLRGRFDTDKSGLFEVRTITPVPYEIPKSGPTGALLAAAGWHAFRPSHLHCIVSAPGHQSLTTQLFFDGDPYLESDVASAVKPGLVLKLSPSASEDGGNTLDYSFRLAPA
jgi:catechol 1,2-dioxygenase